MAVCAKDGCEVEFDPYKSDHKYCSGKCSNSARNHAWRAAHLEEVRAYKRDWARDNYGRLRESISERRSKYNAANAEKNRERWRAYRKSHPEKHREAERRRRERKAENGPPLPHETRLTAAQELRLLASVRKCPDCGCWMSSKPGKKQKTIDHIIPINAGGRDVLENSRVVCFGCNSRKRDRVPPQVDLFNQMADA